MTENEKFWADLEDEMIRYQVREAAADAAANAYVHDWEDADAYMVGNVKARRVAATPTVPIGAYRALMLKRMAAEGRFESLRFAANIFAVLVFAASVAACFWAFWRAR
jgi:hypothetical protein